MDIQVPTREELKNKLSSVVEVNKITNDLLLEDLDMGKAVGANLKSQVTDTFSAALVLEYFARNLAHAAVIGSNGQYYHISVMMAATANELLND